MSPAEWASIIVQLIVAAVAIWYSVETRLLRKQSENQLDVLRRQARLSVTPVLVPGIVVGGGHAQIKAQVEANADVPEDEKQRLLAAAAKGLHFVCGVSNPTARTPLQCTVWIYDAVVRSFRMCDASVECIEERGQAAFSFSGKCYSREQVEAQIEERYKGCGAVCSPHLSSGDDSYILLVCRDLEARAWIFKREFTLTTSGASHRALQVVANFEG